MVCTAYFACGPRRESVALLMSNGESVARRLEIIGNVGRRNKCRINNRLGWEKHNPGLTATVFGEQEFAKPQNRELRRSVVGRKPVCRYLTSLPSEPGRRSQRYPNRQAAYAVKSRATTSWMAIEGTSRRIEDSSLRNGRSLPAMRSLACFTWRSSGILMRRR